MKSQILFSICLYGILITTVTSVCDQSKCKLDAEGLIFQCESAGCTEFPKLDQLKDVTTIKLSHNNITYLPSLPNLPKLEILELSYNQISSIADNAFWFCDILRVLKLDHNNLNSVNSSSFDDFNEGQDLDLSYNALTDIKYGTFPIMMSLKKLNLGHNKLKDVDPTAFLSMEPEVLNLEFNQISNISTEIMAGPKLKSINLSNNQITDLSSHLFRDIPWSLEEVDLSSNLIRNIAGDAFVSDRSEIHDHLKKIDLSRNELTHLKNNTFVIRGLKHLLLDGNLFQEIKAGYFEGCTALSISLKHCSKLKIIKNGAFWKLPALRFVDISNCVSLSVIEAEAFGNSKEMSNITMAVFSNNQLQTLSSALLNWTNVNGIDISQNPWNCDCNIEWMIELGIVWLNMGNTRCASPPSYHNRNIQRLSWEEFVCPTKFHQQLTTHRIIMLLAGGVLTLIILIATVLVVMLRKRCAKVKRKDGFKYKALYNANDSSEDTAVTIEMTFITDKTRRKYKDEPPPAEL